MVSLSPPQMALCVTGFAFLKHTEPEQRYKGNPRRSGIPLSVPLAPHHMGLQQKNVDFSQSFYSSVVGLDLIGSSPPQFTEPPIPSQQPAMLQLAGVFL